MIRLGILAGMLIWALGLVGLASPEETHEVTVHLLEGARASLYLGNKKIDTPPADAHGNTTLTLPYTAGGYSIDAYYCKDGRRVMVEHGQRIPPDSGCDHPVLIGLIPLTNYTTRINLPEPGWGVDVETTTANGATMTSSPSYMGGDYVQDSDEHDLYYVAPSQHLPGLFNVFWIAPDGTEFSIDDVVPNSIGQSRDMLVASYGTEVHTVGPMSGEPVPASQQQEHQNGGTGAAPPTPASTPTPTGPPTPTSPATPPGSKLTPSDMGSTWAGLRAGSVARYGLTALLSLSGGPFTSLFGNLRYFAIPPATSQQQQQQVSYSLVANGNSTGEAFALYVHDPSGRMKTIALPLGTVLEPTGQRLTNQAVADAAGAKQPVNFYCYQFHNQPPSPGSLYRIADPSEQASNEPLRYVLAAVDWLNAEGKLHPDIEVPQYLDAIRQYAVWSKQENWDQKAFTENWIERTKTNAKNLNVKWNKQMEKALNQAAPGRWSDISQALDLASQAERARKRPPAAARPPQAGQP